MRRSALTVALLAACAGDETATSRAALVGGTIDDGRYPAVYYVRSEWNAMRPTHCSATLIAPRVLLMAAHCVDPAKAGSTAVTLYAQNASPALPDGDAGWQLLSDPVFHASYNPGDFRDPYDIGLALLPADQPTAPIAINASPLDAGFVGRPLVAIGFGITSPSVIDPGTRRWVDLTFREVTATHIHLGDQLGAGICNGDSGGSSVHRFADGVTRVVGVHSYTEPGGNCTDGADLRVDVFAGFIRQYLQQHVAPWCGEDGRCADGCATHDPDCPPAVTLGRLGTVDAPAAPQPGCASAPGAAVALALAVLNRARAKRAGLRGRDAPR